MDAAHHPPFMERPVEQTPATLSGSERDPSDDLALTLTRAARRSSAALAERLKLSAVSDVEVALPPRRAD